MENFIKSKENWRSKDNARSALIKSVTLNDAEFLIAKSKNKDSKYYLDRQITNWEYITGQIIEMGMECPEIVHAKIGNQFSVLVFKRLNEENLDSSLSMLPKKLKNYYNSFAKIELTEITRASILTNFLESWPKIYHNRIRHLPSYNRFVEELSECHSCKLVFEHGDLTVNNVIQGGDTPVIIDFEFFKLMQPEGFDLYDFYMSKGDVGKYLDEIPNLKLNIAKYNLVNEINSIVDDNAKFICVDSVKDILKCIELDHKLLTYRGISVIVLKNWIQKHKKERLELIIGFDTDGNIVSFAPWRVRGAKLTVMGTDPDDLEFSPIFASSQKSAEDLLSYLFRNTKREYRIRLLQITSEIYSGLMLSNLQKSRTIIAKIFDAKPILNLHTYVFDKKMKSEYIRLKNRAKGNFSKIHYAQKRCLSTQEASNILQLYRLRWREGPATKSSHLELLEKILMSDECLVFELRADEELVACAICSRLGTKLTLLSPCFDPKFTEYSFGKLILMFAIETAVENGFSELDFGRGAEKYKFNYKPEPDWLVNVRVSKKNNFSRFLANVFG